ncbi:hypothetical protein TNCV_4334301 [Trichonephila clavipes]|nr:hypothetical protein TNCV_4334301 [Trichonephila clavipes]
MNLNWQNLPDHQEYAVKIHGLSQQCSRSRAIQTVLESFGRGLIYVDVYIHKNVSDKNLLHKYTENRRVDIVVWKWATSSGVSLVT